MGNWVFRSPLQVELCAPTYNWFLGPTLSEDVDFDQYVCRTLHGTGIFTQIYDRFEPFM